MDQPKPNLSFRSVKNYYKMPPEEREASLEKMRTWLVTYPEDHPEWKHVLFALDVAYNAKCLERDEFTDMVIDTLT